MKISTHLRKISFFVIFFIQLNYVVSAENKTPTSLKQSIILNSMPIQPVVENLSGTHFVFIGENHTWYANHVKQLEFIQAIYEKNKNIVIGMEMFPNNANKHIADYIHGNSSETEFLKNTNYFLEWGYDYRYYKPILDFARKNKIEVIGLNIKNEIVRKIGHSGFQNITREEFQEIPDQIDFANENYKKSLSEIFSYHPNSQSKISDNFYLAQLVRDEYMAQSAQKYFKEHPKSTLVLLVGNGHVEYGHGIPQRLHRMTGKPYKSILLDYPFKPGAADYFVYTKEIKIEKSPRLKVVLSTETAQLVVKDFTEPENAAKHSLRKGDEVVSINKMPIRSIADIRLVLYDKHPGDVLEISIIRDKKSETVKYTLEVYDRED